MRKIFGILSAFFLILASFTALAYYPGYNVDYRNYGNPDYGYDGYSGDYRSGGYPDGSYGYGGYGYPDAGYAPYGGYEKEVLAVSDDYEAVPYGLYSQGYAPGYGYQNQGYAQGYSGYGYPGGNYGYQGYGSGGYGYPDYGYYQYGNYNYYNTPYKLGECFNLDIVSDNVGVEEGRLAKARIFLKNFSRAPFYIDQINTTDNSPAFSVVPVSSLAVAYPEARNGIELEVAGYPVRVAETGSVVVSVTGHYPNGKICRLQEEFFVSVNKSERLPPVVITPLPNNGFGNGDNGDGENGDNGTGNGKDEKDKVTLCHIPPGNPENAHTIRVGASAVPAHLKHGDYLGACEGETRQKGKDIEIANVPAETDVLNRAALPVTVVNISGKPTQALVTLGGLPEGFSVREKLVTLESGEAKTVLLEIAVNNVDEGTYTADVVVSTPAGLKIGKTSLNVGKSENISIDASVEPLANASLVKLKLKNMLNVATTALLTVETPAGLKVEGDNVALIFDEGDEKELAVKVISEEALTENKEVSVKVKTPDGKVSVKKVTITGGNTVQALGTAMVAFSRGAVNLGILLVLLLSLYFIYRRATSNEYSLLKRTNGNGKPLETPVITYESKADRENSALSDKTRAITEKLRAMKEKLESPDNSPVMPAAN